MIDIVGEEKGISEFCAHQIRLHKSVGDRRAIPNENAVGVAASSRRIDIDCMIFVSRPKKGDGITDTSFQIQVWLIGRSELPRIDEEVLASNRGNCVEQEDHPEPKRDNL